jgi:hypothetical protein
MEKKKAVLLVVFIRVMCSVLFFFCSFELKCTVLLAFRRLLLASTPSYACERVLEGVREALRVSIFG